MHLKFSEQIGHNSGTWCPTSRENKSERLLLHTKGRVANVKFGIRHLNKPAACCFDLNSDTSNQTRKPFLESHLEMWKRHYSKLNFNTWKYSHKNSFEYFLLNIGPLDWVGSEKEAGLKEKVHVLVLTSDSSSNNELLDILVSVKVNSMGDNFQLFGAQRAWNLGILEWAR